ncbi:MAG: hypothetical protein Q8N30_14765 [Methylococcales bacterium]|jgi:hypothetical protein|nr:hypothetical protein [Methylococcales bacterium]
MKLTKSVLLTALLLMNGTAFAYSPEELAKECHKPKFTDFTLPEYKMPEQHQVAPETAFSFKVPAWTNKDTIKLTVKNQAIPFTVESNSSFHKVTSKIPAEFTGKFFRLNASAKVIDGVCHEETGWLIKVEDKAPAEAAPVAVETAPAPAPAITETAPAIAPATPAAANPAPVPATTETAPAVAPATPAEASPAPVPTEASPAPAK